MKSRKIPRTITRLHLGASRLELYDPKVLEVFLNKSWMHLGTKRPKKIRRFWEKSRKKILGCTTKSRNAPAHIIGIYRRTNFEGFHYRRGDALPFDDNTFGYIFSEHFFEHLFPDEALALLEECYRVLRPFGVIRTCVPDSDLRTYEPPEPEGFPDLNLPITHPDKHKTRWSVYSLTKALEDAGFEAVPLRYCDKTGNYTRVSPADIRTTYDGCPDKELIFDMGYIRRIDSLIVDGIKQPPE